MDPVDKTILWIYGFQQEVYSGIKEVANSGIVTGSIDFVHGKAKYLNGILNDKIGKTPPPEVTNTKSIDNYLIHNKKFLAFILGGAIGGGVFYKYYFATDANLVTIRNNKKYIKTDRRRRAKRLFNGARSNVVIIIGSALEPLVRVVANDLEKRGLIVYISAINAKDIAVINNEHSEDIRAFKVDSKNEDTLKYQIDNFGKILNRPVTPFPGATSHSYKLVGVIVIPDLFYPIGPIENVSLKSWSDCLTGKILSPLVLFTNGFLELIRNNNAIKFDDEAYNVLATKLILLTPNLISSINLPFHAPETVAVNSLNSVFESLARETANDKLLNIEIINLKLGAVNLFNHGDSGETQARMEASLQNQILGWDDNMKSIYGPGFKHICELSGPSPRLRGSSLRELNYKIFDLLYSDVGYRRRVRYTKDIKIAYIGRGAKAYDIIGKFLPGWFISLLIGCSSFSNVFSRFIGY